MASDNSSVSLHFGLKAKRDSFDIIQTINSLKEEFDIEIPATEIIPENFNSAKGLWDMVQRLLDEE